jgi:peptidoglycan hydrolase-like protein with peptidoglycan-binding domain
MKRNIIVSLLITTVALGMQPARAQREAREQDPASTSDSVVDQQVVSTVEVALDKEGYYVGNTNGQFTGDTRTAVASFQRRHGLTVTGTITPEVLTALELK